MKLSTLGYTKKWLRYGLLTEEQFAEQLKHYKASEEEIAENYRYTSFINWIKDQESFTDREIENFIELAVDDTNTEMSGMAVKTLFESSKLTPKQFETLCIQLPTFGDWTKKIIEREKLVRRIESEELTMELLHECLAYKKMYADNRFITSIIKQTDDLTILSEIKGSDVGKRIKTLTEKRINKILREQN
ncbi:MAG: hypothetical protein ACPGSD_02020 [Flavobacteriales bacterium]